MRSHTGSDYGCILTARPIYPDFSEASSSKPQVLLHLSPAQPSGAIITRPVSLVGVPTSRRLHGSPHKALSFLISYYGYNQKSVQSPRPWSGFYTPTCILRRIWFRAHVSTPSTKYIQSSIVWYSPCSTVVLPSFSSPPPIRSV